MNIQFYLLRAVTNVHVGSGEANFGVIDNLIARDAATGFPCIPSSGLKGAIKQQLQTELTKQIFGSDSSANKTVKKKSDQIAGKEASGSEYGDDTQQGECSFLPAYLLAMPVRSDREPFVLATCSSMINHFLSLWKDLNGSEHGEADKLKSLAKLSGNIKDDSTVYCDSVPVLPGSRQDLGGLDVLPVAFPDPNGAKTLEKMLGCTTHPVVLISDAMMLELCDDMNLPVLARNVLEDGKSQNLWYEQVLPRESLMFFVVIWGNEAQEKEGEKMLNSFLQVGANASVGYGLTRISKLS